MADAKVTISGDSDGAQSAIKAVADGLGELDEQLEEIGETTDELASSSQKGQTALRGLGAASASVSTQAKATATQMNSVVGALGAISPEASAAAGALQSVVGSLGGVAGAVTPAAAGVAALTAVVGLAIAAHEKQVKAIEAMGTASQAAARKVAEAARTMQEMNRASASSASSFISMASSVREAADALDEYDRAAAPKKAQRELEESYRRQLDLQGAIIDAERDIQAANERRGRAQARLARLQEMSDKGALISRAEMARANNELSLSLSALQMRTLDLSKAQRAYNDELEDFKRVNVAVDALSGNLSRIGQKTEQVAASATRSARDIADAMVRAGVVARDLGEAMASIGGGEVGRELVDILSSVGDDTLRALGATEQQVKALRDLSVEYASGAERLASAQDGVTAAMNAQRATMQAIVDAQRESERVAMARQQLEVDIATTAAQERMDQAAWFTSVSRSYEEQIAYENDLRDAAMTRMQEGAILRDEERQALEQHFELIRMEQEAQIARAGELSLALQEGIGALGESGITDMIGGLSESLGSAAASGASFGEAMGASAKKAVAAIAKQYGALFMATGTGMLFMPGQQAQGAGLIAAGAALMAIGGAVGAAGKKGGAKKDAGSSGGGQATVVVDTFERDSPGARARDTGAERDNADRYGIDRGRAWA